MVETCSSYLLPISVFRITPKLISQHRYSRAMSYSKLSPTRRIAAALLPITALSLAACGSLPFASQDASPATETSAAAPSFRARSYSVGIGIGHCQCHRYGVSHRLGGPLRLG